MFRGEVGSRGEADRMPAILIGYYGALPPAILMRREAGSTDTDSIRVDSNATAICRRG